VGFPWNPLARGYNLENLEDGLSIEEIMEQFDVTREQVTAVLDFAARSLEAPIAPLMLILFDHGTPRGISRALRGHIVKEARAQGWDTLSNGDLLNAAEEAGFEVLLTTDTNLPHQQNLKGHKLAIVILSKNRWTLMRPMMQLIANA
jgi:hypothetical protein